MLDWWRYLSEAGIAENCAHAPDVAGDRLLFSGAELAAMRQMLTELRDLYQGGRPA